MLATSSYAQLETIREIGSRIKNERRSSNNNYQAPLGATTFKCQFCFVFARQDLWLFFVEWWVMSNFDEYWTRRLVFAVCLLYTSAEEYGLLGRPLPMHLQVAILSFSLPRFLSLSCVFDCPRACIAFKCLFPFLVDFFLFTGKRLVRM